MKVVVHSHLVHWVVHGRLSRNCNKMEGVFCVVSKYGMLERFSVSSIRNGFERFSVCGIRNGFERFSVCGITNGRGTD